MCMNLLSFDPPGHGRIYVVFIFTQGVRTSVRPSQKRATTNTMHENNDHLLLAGAWWVILKSPDFFLLNQIPLSPEFP